jgi:CRP-like cAMP-binding protein
MAALKAGGFDPRQFLERVGEGKRIGRYRPGEVIFKQGAQAAQVYYLQEGKAKETVTSEAGKDAVIGMIEPGMFFGTSGLDGADNRSSTVTAIVPCLVTEITLNAMRQALQIPRFAQLFVFYLLHLNSRIEAERVNLLFNSSEKRLAQKLLILAHWGDGPPQVIGPEVTQEMLAEMIGTTRPRVNHFLNKFRRLGFIKYNGGITVLPSLLRTLLQDELHSKESDA